MPDIGLREILMVAVAVTAAYLLLSVLRLLQVFRRRPRPAEPAAAEPSAGGGASSEAAAEVATVAASEIPRIEIEAVPEPAQEPERQRHWLPQWLRGAAQRRAAATGVAAEPDETAAGFGEQLFRSTLEAELQHLRSDVAGLREELKLLKAARRVSPQYNEAMMLAQRGIDAQGIAEQCGISVGEAELVLALSRNRQEYEDYGEDDPRRPAG